MFNNAYSYMCCRMLNSRAMNTVGVEAFGFACPEIARCCK